MNLDHGSIQGSHRPISFISIKHRTRANHILCKTEYQVPGINIDIVGVVNKNHTIRTCLMYHAACKVEFQPFTRSYSQLTFSTFYKNISGQCGLYVRMEDVGTASAIAVQQCSVLCSLYQVLPVQQYNKCSILCSLHQVLPVQQYNK